MSKGFRAAQVRRDSRGRFAPAKKKRGLRRLLANVRKSKK